METMNAVEASFDEYANANGMDSETRAIHYPTWEAAWANAKADAEVQHMWNETAKAEPEEFAD